ncbi:MAG: GNAT family N-acetyltransferase [Bacteroidota bacterium]
MLTGTKIKLRALEPSDIDLLYQWENDPSIWRLSNTVVPFSKFVLEKYIADAHLDIYTTKQLRLMITKIKSTSPLEDSKPACGVSLSFGEGRGEVGCIDLFDFDPNNLRAGVGILIADPSDRKKGYASEALEQLISYCFTTLNIHQLYCNITVDNEASIVLFEKHGFQMIGIKKDWIRNEDKWIDEYVLQLINS